MFTQQQHPEWHRQWATFHDDSLVLFTEWIKPNTLETFRGLDVVDCGCGGGQHVGFVAPYARHVLGIDLNTADLAREHNADKTNVSFLGGDLATIKLDHPYDIAYCIGVIQHTTDPDKTFANIKTFVKLGGRIIIWCYAKEGNWLNWGVLEPLKRGFLLRLPHRVLVWLSSLLTALLYPVIYTIYFLPLPGLPYYDYFRAWRKLSFRRNQLNVFDKLNAPVTNFISRVQVEQWFNPAEFTDVHLDWYNRISWRASGVKRKHRNTENTKTITTSLPL